MSNLLSVENLTMKFGGLTAIDDLSFDAKNNQITSIIGPNGAVKQLFLIVLQDFINLPMVKCFYIKRTVKFL